MFDLPNYVFYIFLSPKGRTGSNKIFIGMPIIPFDTIHRTFVSMRLRSNFLDEIQIDVLITISCH